MACNVFDITTADPREHFLQALIVAYLASSIGGRDQDGFVPGDMIVAELAKSGFLPTQIDPALRRLAQRKMIETPYSHYREIPVADAVPPREFHFRATSVGIYHVRFWMGSFSFLDAVSTDTPILDDNTRYTVSRLASSLEIADRYRKAKAFRDYLEAKWHLSNLNVGYFDFPAIIAENSGQFASVERVLQRSRAPARSHASRPHRQ